MKQDGRSGLGEYVPDAIRGRFVAKLAVAVVVAIIVSSAIGLVLYGNATDRVESQVSERVTSTAQLQADGLRSWITGLRDQTRTMSAAGEFQRGNVEEIQQRLFKQRRTLPEDIAAVHYVSASDGEVLATTHREISGATLSDQSVPWAQNMSRIDRVTNDASRVVVASEPYRSPATGERVIAFVSTPPKNTVEAVVVEASLDARADQFYQTSAEASTTVLRRDGSYVMGARSENETLPTAVTTAERAGLTHRSETVVGFAPVNQTSWVLATVVPKSASYAMRDYVGSSLLAALGATIGVFVVATMAFGRRSARTLDALTQRARAIENGDLDVDLSTDRVDEFGRLYGAFDEMRDSLREQIAAAESAREQAEQARDQAESARTEADEARAEAERLNERLEVRAAEYGEVMAACADGDLTRRLDADAESDAMAEIAGSYNDMMDAWETTIRQVREFGDAVGTATDDVSETVDAVRDRSAGVQTAAAAMADDATTQSEKLSSVSAELNDLSATVEEVSTAADSVRTTADEALDRSESGRQAAAAAATALDEIEASTDQTLDQVEALDDLAGDIERVTDLIADIAEQTNVLALNANIEAARAGNGDRAGTGAGFAVVAEEVKDLADETVDATDEIETSIDRMREQVAATVAEVRGTERKVADGSETISEALDAFDDVADGIRETTDGVREIDRATADQAESTQEVVAMVDQVSDISDRTAEQAETVAADAANQSSAVDGVERNISTLGDRAGELHRALAAFETNSAASATDPTASATGPVSTDRSADSRPDATDETTEADD